jgi:hypothetical protein
LELDTLTRFPILFFFPQEMTTTFVSPKRTKTKTRTTKNNPIAIEDDDDDIDHLDLDHGHHTITMTTTQSLANASPMRAARIQNKRISSSDDEPSKRPKKRSRTKKSGVWVSSSSAHAANVSGRCLIPPFDKITSLKVAQNALNGRISAFVSENKSVTSSGFPTITLLVQQCIDFNTVPNFNCIAYIMLAKENVLLHGKSATCRSAFTTAKLLLTGHLYALFAMADACYVDRVKHVSDEVQNNPSCSHRPDITNLPEKFTLAGNMTKEDYPLSTSAIGRITLIKHMLVGVLHSNAIPGADLSHAVECAFAPVPTLLKKHDDGLLFQDCLLIRDLLFLHEEEKQHPTVTATAKSKAKAKSSSSSSSTRSRVPSARSAARVSRSKWPVWTHSSSRDELDEDEDDDDDHDKDHEDEDRVLVQAMLDPKPRAHKGAYFNLGIPMQKFLARAAVHLKDGPWDVRQFVSACTRTEDPTKYMSLGNLPADIRIKILYHISPLFSTRDNYLLTMPASPYPYAADVGGLQAEYYEKRYETGHYHDLKPSIVGEVELYHRIFGKEKKSSNDACVEQK